MFTVSITNKSGAVTDYNIERDGYTQATVKIEESSERVEDFGGMKKYKIRKTSRAIVSWRMNVSGDYFALKEIRMSFGSGKTIKAITDILEARGWNDVVYDLKNELRTLGVSDRQITAIEYDDKNGFDPKSIALDLFDIRRNIAS